jgi:hypothetical protein
MPSQVVGPFIFHFSQKTIFFLYGISRPMSWYYLPYRTQRMAAVDNRYMVLGFYKTTCFVDRRRFDFGPDPDPTFSFDADPDPDLDSTLKLFLVIY